MFKNLSKLLSLLSIVLLLVACGSTDNKTQEQSVKQNQKESVSQPDKSANNAQASSENDVFTMAVSYIPTTLVPTNSDQDEEKSMKQPIFDQLCHLTSDGYQARIAKSIDISDDGLTYTVKLQDDATWSDGEPITADDVIFAIDYEMEVNQGASAYRQIDGEPVEISKLDDKTIEFALPKPSAFYLVRISGIRVMPSHAFNNPSEVDSSGYFSNPDMATSGPYKVSEISADYIVYTKRDDYYGGQAGIEKYILRTVGDGANRNIALENGEISYTRIQNKEDLEKYSNDDRFKIVSVPEDRVNTLDFNMYGPNSRNFSDEQRRAIAMAIDKDEVIAVAYGGSELAEPANQLITPGLSGHNPDIKGIEYNPEEAKRIAEETGLTDMTLIYIYNRDRTHMQEQAVAIQNQLARIGITVDIQGYDSPTFFNKYNKPVMADKAPMNEWDLATNGWNSQRGIGGGLSQFFTIYPADAGFSKETKDLVQQANEAANQEEAQDLWDAYQEKALEESWIIPLTNTNYVMAVRADIVGLENTLVPEITDFISLDIEEK